MRKRILVTDGDERAALAVTRSLGRDNDVYVCAPQAQPLAGVSRYCCAYAVVRDPLTSPKAFTKDILKQVRAWEIDVVIPIADPSLLSLLEEGEERVGARIPFPDIDTVLAVSDKSKVCAAALDLGISIPKQYLIRNKSELSLVRNTSEEIPYPVVIKPFRSVVRQKLNGGMKKLGVCYASNQVQLEEKLRLYSAESFPLLIQQRVNGPGVGIFTLTWNGEEIATFAHRRIHEKPPSGGVSVLRESVVASEGLLTRSRELLARFGWTGVAMIEYKIDAVTGTPYLMEINGRFWGSTQLAIDAGVDFPKLLLAVAAGERVSPVNTYAVGVQSRWWWGEVDHLLARMFKPAHELHLPPDAPGKWRVLRDFVAPPGQPGCPCYNEIFRWSDPLPAILESVDWFTNLFASLSTPRPLSSAKRAGQEWLQDA